MNAHSSSGPASGPTSGPASGPASDPASDSGPHVSPEQTNTLERRLHACVAAGEIPETLAQLLLCLCATCTEIARLIRLNGHKQDLQAVGDTNVHGESQKALDVLCNELLVKALDESATAIACQSEEMTEMVAFDGTKPRAPWLVVFDPVDGSSNIGVNGTLGTIFSALPASAERPPKEEDFLQSGRNQRLAGYVLYGPATEMMFTFGNGVWHLIADEDNEDFIVMNEAVTIPVASDEIAINAINEPLWEAPVRTYFKDCQAGKAGPRGQNFTLRWLGAMIGDIHRILLRGGIFLYPMDERNRARGGRLRLMYEGNPCALLMEQAGGFAGTGNEPLLDILPTNIHQRTPIIMGSRDEVSLVESYHARPSTP